MSSILLCAIVGAYSDGGGCSTEVAHKFLEDFCTPVLVTVPMYSSTLKMEETRSYDTLSSTHRNTRRRFPYKPSGFG